MNDYFVNVFVCSFDIFVKQIKSNCISHICIRTLLLFAGLFKMTLLYLQGGEDICSGPENEHFGVKNRRETENRILKWNKWITFLWEIVAMELGRIE